MSSPAAPIAAIEKTVDVQLPPADAFRLFTEQLPRWWPMASHSVLAGEAAGFVFGCAVGDAVYELAHDGRRHEWGTITEWSPPWHLAMTWHPGRNAGEATRLSVQFLALPDGGTRIELCHDGWEARAGDPRARDRYDDGWATVLRAFADGAAERPESRR